MTLSELFQLISWDFRVNLGWSFDSLQAKLLLIEIRLEQYLHRKTHAASGRVWRMVWYLCRFPGSVFQWFLCNANISGSITLGRGRRLPHPQNISIAASSDIGEFCTSYQNVTIAWNNFKPRGSSFFKDRPQSTHWHGRPLFLAQPSRSDSTAYPC